MINPLFLMMRLVQTVPLSLLTFAAFPDDALRRNRRTSVPTSAAYMVLCSVVMALISPLTSENGQRNIVARDLVLAVVLCLYIVLWAYAVRAPKLHKALVFGLLLHYWMALQTLGDVFAALILRDGYRASVSAESGSLTYNLCVLAASVLTFPLMLGFLSGSVRRNLPVLGVREAKRGGAYLLAVFLLFSVATYEPRFDLLPDTPLFVAALLLTDMIAYYIFFQELGETRRQGELARELEVYQMQYRQISARMEETARLRHDLRHHLNALGALNAQGKRDEIADYLKRYGTVYDELEAQKLCGDPVVDSVLGYYLALCAEEDVPARVNVRLRGETGVAATDMTVLLGNCLENAMNALRKLPKEERRLELDLRPMDAVLLLQVVNACGEPGDTGGFTGWETFVKGRRGGVHGTGLRSVSAIAEKYGGSARFRRENGTFTAQVVLNLLGEK